MSSDTAAKKDAAAKDAAARPTAELLVPPRPALSPTHYVAQMDNPLDEVDTVRALGKPSNLWIDAWRDVRTRPMFYISSALILLVLVAALFPALFTAEDPELGLLSRSLGGPEAGHPLGFSKQGYDIYARIVYGASTSLTVGLLVTILTTVLGLVFGAFAGYYGGWIDSVLSRAGDIFFAIPYILAAVVIMSALSSQRSVFVMALAIGAFSWPSTARILRSQVLRVKEADYVMASTAIGIPKFQVMLAHVLPNSIAPVIVVTTISLAAAITAEATLSFLGLGIPNTISWGGDISSAQTILRTDPQVLIYPSIALSVTVLSFIMLGEVIRDALDPKARASR